MDVSQSIARLMARLMVRCRSALKYPSPPLKLRPAPSDTALLPGASPTGHPRYYGSTPSDVLLTTAIRHR